MAKIKSLFHPRIPDVHFDINEYRGDNPELLEAMIETWQRYFPKSVASPGLDLEDFAENAIRLYEADLSCAFEIITYTHNTDVLFDAEGVPCAPESLYGSEFFHLGCHTSAIFDSIENKYQSTIINDARNMKGALEYWQFETFKAMSGRHIIIADMDLNEKSLNGIYAAFKKIESLGHTHAFVKTKSAKYFTGMVSVDMDRFSNSDLAWAFVHMENAKNELIVQEPVRMRHEYRIAVVNHQPVAGAGCIEEFTPLNNDGAAFDMKLREHRKYGSQVIEAGNDAIIERYQEFAKAFTNKLQRESPETADYTLDLALNDNDDVIIVELNRLHNYGLYAMNYQTVINAHIERFQPANHLNSHASQGN